MTEASLNPGELPNDVTIVKFFKPNCGPCRSLDNELTGKDFIKDINFLSINPQKNIDWALEFNIRSVPTTIGFVDNKEVFRVVGNKASEIESSVKELKNK